MITPGSFLADQSATAIRRIPGALLAALAVFLVSASPSLAQNINWVGGTSMDWNTAANWSSGTVPTSSNNITLDTNSGNQAVISTASASSKEVIVGNTTASGANTSLTIQGGEQLTSGNFYIGNATGSTGSVLVTDPGSVLSTTLGTGTGGAAAQQIGVNGTASLTIANGAGVVGMSVVGAMSAGNGTVLVTGDGSSWTPGRDLYAGLSGSSNITLADGASITTAIGITTMIMAGKNSQFTITGQAASGNHSIFSTQGRLLDEATNSTVTISNGGELIASAEGIALSGNATTALLTDPGSEMVSVTTATPDIGINGIYVGFANKDNASLTIANGANLTTNVNYIGYAANSTGSVTITGNGSVWNATGNIVVGNATNSTASLTLANGGSINITGGNIIFGQNGGNGTLNLNDGAFFQDGKANGSLVFNVSGVYNNDNHVINWNGGTLQVVKNITYPGNMTMTGNGCTLDTNGFNVTFGGVLSGTGGLTKNGNGNLSLSLGGNAPGGTFYTGNTTINEGTLNITGEGPINSNLSTNITDDANLSIGSSFGSFHGNYTGVLSGNGTLSINGNVTMTGNCTFTGTIQAGSNSILSFNGDTSQLGGSIINNGVELNFAQNFDTSYAGNITGNGSGFLNKSGTGNLTLSGNISSAVDYYDIQVQAGNLVITGNISQFEGGVNIASGANVVINQASDESFGSGTGNVPQISGSGNFIQAGNTNLTLNFGSNGNGNILINSGTVAIGGYVYQNEWSIVDNTALILTSINGGIYSGPISGNGTVTLSSPANITFTANNTYTGNTTINSSTLLVDGQQTATSTTVSSGGALSGNGTITGPIAIAAGGTLAPGSSSLSYNYNGTYTVVTGTPGTFAPGSSGIGTLTVNNVSLDPAATTSFALADLGNYTNLTVTGQFAEAGNVVINLNSGLQAGTYQLISGNLSNDFGNITVTGLYSTALTDSGGVWTGSTSGVNFTFSAATGQLVVNYTIVPLSPTGTTSFSLTAPGNVTPLSVNGTLAEAGNLVLNLSSNLYTGTYQLFTSNGGFSNDFSNVTLTGLYSAALTDNGGVWSGNVSGTTFTFNAATGQLVVTPTLPSGISATKSAWLEQYFTVPQLLDPTISGDTASPAGDGIPNLMKYALNLNPLVDGHAGLPQLSTDGVYLYFFFVPYQNDVNYTIEACTDLSTWSSNGVNVYPYYSDLVGSYPVPADGTTVFMRLVVTPSD